MFIMCAKMIKDTIHDKSAYIAYKKHTVHVNNTFSYGLNFENLEKNRFFPQKIAAFFRISRKFLAENVY